MRAAIAKDEYCFIYPHLLSHFQSVPHPLSRSNLIAALHVVYGWMPTIARPGPSLRVLAGKGDTVVKIVETARVSEGPTLTAADMDLLKQFTNNSTVGSSKLLHFFNPIAYPIWDSRVAKRFMWDSVAQETYDKSSRFLTYIGALWNWARDPAVRTAIADLRKLNAHLGIVTDMRILELVLFHPAP